MAILRKTVYNSHLRTPFSYTVVCGGKKAEFRYDDRDQIGKWMTERWKEQEDGFFNTHKPAYVYCNIDWDCDHVLYVKYELEGEIKSGKQTWTWITQYA